MPRRRTHAPGPATEVQAPMQAKGNRRPRRRPVARHAGIYYRPQPGGKVAPPYEIRYLDSSGKRRWAVVHGSLDDAEARRAELRLRRRRGERIEPIRQTFAEYAREWLERQDVRPRTREISSWGLEQHLIPRLGRRRLDQISCEDVAALIALMLAAGLRIGEALGLAVCDLDRTHSLIRVECQLGRDGQRTPLKTAEAQRTIDIPPQLMHRLLALVEERAQFFNPGALVFASRNETGLVRKVAREALKRAVKAAQLAPPAPTLHDLRHSHASMLIALDVSLVDVQRRLGHRKPDTTLRLYAHQWKEREARRSQVGRQLGQLFDERALLPAHVPGRGTRLALPPAR